MAASGWHEGAVDVSVNESTGPRCIRRRACMAWAHGGSAKRGWRVRGDVRERTNAVVASV
eukprot:1831406-Pleurochrysis_carterae.AAC.1